MIFIKKISGGIAKLIKKIRIKFYQSLQLSLIVLTLLIQIWQEYLKAFSTINYTCKGFFFDIYFIVILLIHHAYPCKAVWVSELNIFLINYNAT